MEVTGRFLSTVDDWISKSAQFVTRQLLLTLKDLLGGIQYICVYVCNLLHVCGVANHYIITVVNL